MDWSKHHNNGHTNDGYCRNYGYRQLNSNGQYVDLSSGAYGKEHFFPFSILIFPKYSLFLLGYYGWYEENERCYWGIYAPGAQKLRFQLINDFEVR